MLCSIMVRNILHFVDISDTLKSVKIYLERCAHTCKKCRIEVPVLDATAIGVSMLRGDFSTASSVMFLLGFGEILEDWTHKKVCG